MRETERHKLRKQKRERSKRKRKRDRKPGKLSEAQTERYMERSTKCRESEIA